MYHVNNKSVEIEKMATVVSMPHAKRSRFCGYCASEKVHIPGVCEDCFSTRKDTCTRCKRQFLVKEFRTEKLWSGMCSECRSEASRLALLGPYGAAVGSLSKRSQPNDDDEDTISITSSKETNAMGPLKKRPRNDSPLLARELLTHPDESPISKVRDSNSNGKG